LPLGGAIGRIMFLRRQSVRPSVFPSDRDVFAALFMKNLEEFTPNFCHSAP